jgi:PAS domain S-box-containing protein
VESNKNNSHQNNNEEINNFARIFDTYLNKSTSGFCLIDSGAVIVYANKAFERITGFTQNEIAGKKITELSFYTSDDVSNIAINYLSDKTNDQPFLYEFDLVGKKGKHKWVELTIIPIEEKGTGNTIGFIVNITDKSEIKLIQEQGKFSTYAFRAIRKGMVITDTSMKIIQFNSTAENIFKISSSEAIGKKIFDALKLIEPTTSAIEKQLDDFASHGKAHWEHRIQTGREQIWIEAFVQKIKDENNKHIANLAIVSDITERKKMEEKLRKSEASLAEAQRIAKLGSWYLDIENDELIWSDEMYRLFGYQPGEVTPTKELFMNHVHPEDLSLAHSTIYAHESGEFHEESSNIIIRLYRKNGDAWYGNSKACSVFNGSGKVTKEFGSIQDISDIKEAEEREKRIQQELSTASRLASIGEVTSGLVHEINNPLTGVIGFSQLLIDKDLPEDIKEDIEVINYEAQRAAKIVSGLLTFAHQDEPGLTVSDINRIILDTIDLRSYEMEMNGIDIVTDLADNLPKATVDEVQLQQAFLNIILNAEQAIKNSKKKGVFTVKTEYINNTIRISFIDDGPGISKDNLERIFTPLFSIKNDCDGMGLGLSMTHNIITQHHGKIFAESELGHGTKFIIELPVTDAITTSER